ncbi:MAG: Uma2 family endonuclease [Candidatus Sericytochromatia bacterium]|nr:Uma2 family endonuclease [Candidatus Tanganyikabacteria bacterium]
MATQSHRSFMTYEEFAALPREGMITMLLDGEYIVAPSPVRRHQIILGRLHLELGLWLRAAGRGTLYLAPLDVVLSKAAARVIQPDIFYLTDDAPERWENGILLGMPDLAIEILSKNMNRYDKGRKLEYYDEYGTRELWHVHQERPKVEVYRRDPAGRLGVAATLGGGDRLETPLLPGFSLELALLYAELP